MAGESWVAPFSMDTFSVCTVVRGHNHLWCEFFKFVISSFLTHKSLNTENCIPCNCNTWHSIFNNFQCILAPSYSWCYRTLSDNPAKEIDQYRFPPRFNSGLLDPRPAQISVPLFWKEEIDCTVFFPMADNRDHHVECSSTSEDETMKSVEYRKQPTVTKNVSRLRVNVCCLMLNESRAYLIIGFFGASDSRQVSIHCLYSFP